MWHKVPEMTREAWLQWRREGIGGSDAAAILDCSPWSTPYKIWMEKVNDYREKENWAMNFGRETEEQSRKEFEDRMGEGFFPLNIQSDRLPWMKASLDGINLEGTKVVEIKKASKKDHELAFEGMVPPKYIPQCQHILMILDLPMLYYFSSPADGRKGIILQVQRDTEFILNTLFVKELEFWKRVVEKCPPPLTEKDKKTFGIQS